MAHSATKRGHREAPSKDEFSDWMTLTIAPIKDSKGVDCTLGEMVLRRDYTRAIEGHLPTIKVMMSMVKANAEARSARRMAADYYSCDDPVVERRRLAKIREERKAEPALLLLGIAVVENHLVPDPGDLDDPVYATQVKCMRPTHLAPWVVEFARSRDDRPPLSSSRWSAKEQGCLSEADPRAQKWQEHKRVLLEHVVALRGPHGAKFTPGKCPNRKGRPRRKPHQEIQTEYPHDGFFMEPVKVPLGGKDHFVSRLDALMCLQVQKALKGDDRLLDLIAPTVAALVEAGWNVSAFTGLDESYRS